MAALEKQKASNQKLFADALIKAEEAARSRQEKLSQEIQSLKGSIKTTQSDRDKARAVIVAKEARWKEVNPPPPIPSDICSCY